MLTALMAPDAGSAFENHALEVHIMGIDTNRSIQELKDVGFTEAQAVALVGLIAGQQDYRQDPTADILPEVRRLTWPMFGGIAAVVTTTIAWALFF